MVFKYFWLFVVAVSSSPLDPPEEFLNPYRSTRDVDGYRLPEGAYKAINYMVYLRLPRDVFNTTNIFEAASTLEFMILQNTNEIIIQANGLNITDAILLDGNSNRITFEQSEFVSDPKTDILNLTTTTQLTANSIYKLTFAYNGSIRTDSMSGFYRSSYVDANDQTVYLGSTQFQPVHARKVFPCFDEPSFKAVFHISIRHQIEYRAIGNTEGNRVIDLADRNFVITNFAPTPEMPTYLIAFVVSDFNCTTGEEIQAGIPHYICSRPEATPIRELASEYGPKLTWSMEGFTGVTYNTSTITKIHQFAIPDFSAGAMENWGLVTYRERYLLWDPDHSSNRYMQSVITIVAHELAHFWFGDLVTCDWWSNTFLNEGFATYFEYHATYDVEPRLETDKQFVIEQLQAVLVSDASSNSVPLSSPANSPEDISGRFSSISYNKGGSIFRMVQHFMGLENFKQGLQKYLTDNQFSNTEPTQLWAALSEFATAALPPGQTLNSVMDNWVNKAGYPLLKVTRSGQNIAITQNRFLSNKNAVPDAADVWYVPISYTTSVDPSRFQNTSVQYWLPPTGTGNINGVLPSQDDWIILNNQQIGYYRVDYDDALWTNIKTALNTPGFGGIHELNRAQIVDDVWNFVRYGYKDFSELLNLFEFLKKDTSYYTWWAAFGAFNNIMVRVSNEQTQTRLSGHILELSEIVYNSVPFNEAKEDDHIYTLKKVLVVPWACRLGLQDCIDNANTAFANYKANSIKPDKNLRSVIYCNGLRHSTNIQEDWNHLWNEFIETKLSDEQVTILSALGCAKNATILKNYLSKTISGTGEIRPQDVNSVFSAVNGGNPENVDVLLEWLLENYREVDTILGSLITQINNVASRFTTNEQIDRLRQFVQDAEISVTQNDTINGIINGAVNNLALTTRFEQELNLHFEARTASGESLKIGLVTVASIILVLLSEFLY